MTTKPFWESKTLADLTEDEWESLCDGCGRCCLRKLEDSETGHIAYTDVACRLLDTEKCRCKDYEHRTDLVADCVRLRPGDRASLAWMPTTCAYRQLDSEGTLPNWHPLVSKTENSVHDAGISVAGRCISEEFVHEDDVEFRIIDWVTAGD